MKYLLAFVLAFTCSLVSGQPFSIGDGAAKSSHPTPDTIMTPGKLYINMATMPEPHSGRTALQYTYCEGDETIGDCSSWANPLGTFPDGASRFPCTTSHFGFEDPIVFPAQPGKTHLHIFFGNNTTNSTSDLLNQANVGTSTCSGGGLNKTGYWTPAGIYSCYFPAVQGCDANRNGTIYSSTINLVYYKSGLDSSVDHSQIQWPKAGHRMISGFSNSQTLQGGHMAFSCTNQYDHGSNTVAWVPNTDEYQGAGFTGGTCDLNQFVGFPKCHDGVNLDVPDHMSHMAEADYYAGCTNPSFPYMIPDISFNVHYDVRDVDLDSFRFSSDEPPLQSTTQTSTDTTHVKLNAATSAVDQHYLHGLIWINGQKRAISDYNGTTKVATLAVALSATPTAGTSYVLQTAAGMTTHGDWANGWNQTDVIVNGKTVVQLFLDQCIRSFHDCNVQFFDANPTFNRSTLPKSLHRWYYLYN